MVNWLRAVLTAVLMFNVLVVLAALLRAVTRGREKRGATEGSAGEYTPER